MDGLICSQQFWMGNLNPWLVGLVYGNLCEFGCEFDLTVDDNLGRDLKSLF